ncbi:MAG: hypothetical protein RMY16_02130 [Nostoc sp. DedQUE12b]|uniref:hypothetical protein n=1 Tax=Nostoc sp. DedQUE12b TaxID=3075398 RepID=UPI002AD4E792|nr:hypothetical protein [Nostoc sp. DedQUE12b]MDZ8084382.1 hypothetical protein [Nostoc sp. DedQUE12b]
MVRFKIPLMCGALRLEKSAIACLWLSWLAMETAELLSRLKPSSNYNQLAPALPIRFG